MIISVDLDIVSPFLHFLPKGLPYFIAYYTLYVWKHQKVIKSENVRNNMVNEIQILSNKVQFLENRYYKRKENAMNIEWKGCNPKRYRTDRKYYYAATTIYPKWIVGKQAPIDKIIYHQIGGYLSTTTNSFQTDKDYISAHFGVRGDVIHQYAKLEHTTYHCGNGKANSESIGIEHEIGEIKQPNGTYIDYGFTNEVYENSAQLVVLIAKQLGKRVDDFQHLPHKNFYNTRCPGTLDIGRIVTRAREIEAAQMAGVGIDQPVNQPAVSGQTVSYTSNVVVQKWVRVTSSNGVNVRKEAKLPSNGELSNIFAVYDKGSEIEVTELVEGQSVSGNNKWYKTKRSGVYIWSGAVQEFTKQVTIQS